jgi:hypothetical protein
MNDNEPSPMGKPQHTDRPRLHVSPVNLYFGLLIFVAGLLFATQAPQLEGNVAVLGLLIALNVAAGLMPIDVYGDSKISVGFVIALAIIVIFGAPGAVILAPVAAVAPRVIDRQGIEFKVVANAALLTVVYSLAAATYSLVAPLNPTEVTASMALGIGLATVTTFAVSAVLLSVPGKLHGQSVSELWNRHSWITPHYATMGVVGFGLVAAYESLAVLGVIVFAMPAVMMRFAMKQYVDKTAENVQKLSSQNDALRVAHVQIQEVNEELRHSYDDTLEALVNALDARDQETKGHSIRVSNYMMDIAAELGVREGTKEWVDMQRGSLLHDVGKIGVSDNILLKPGKLTDEEWQLMRLHPEIGYNMLRDVKFLSGAAEIVFSHHERWDGKGYPRGLKGEDVPLGARIFAVCDTFDSMTSDRPYRKALSTMESMNEILKFRGSQFDPLVVEAFLDIYDTWVVAREELHRETKAAA